MNEYGLWNILAVIVAVAAFIGTQLTARRNERAEFLLNRVTLLTNELAALAESLKDKTKEIQRLTEENIALMRKLAGIQNGKPL